MRINKEKLKAVITAGATILTLSACGTQDTPNEKNDSQIVTEETTSEKERTETTNIHTTTTSTKTTSTNETVTTATTKSNSTETTKAVQTTKKAVQTTKNNSTDTTQKNNTTQTTNNNSTKEETQEETKITVEKENQTQTTTQVETPKQTEPQTEAPTEAQTEPEIEIRDYSKYDLLDSDPEVAARAFEQLSNELCEELYNGSLVVSDYDVTAGFEQARTLLAVLNYDQGINPQALGAETSLGKYSREDLQQYGKEISLPRVVNRYGAQLDFNKYVIDEYFANFLTEVTNNYKEYLNSNDAPLLEQTSQYFEEYDVESYSNIDNYIKAYIMIDLGMEASGYYSIEKDEEAYGLYVDNVINPLYDSYSPYKGYSYTR